MKNFFKIVLLIISICVVSLVVLNSLKSVGSEKSITEKKYYGIWKIAQVAGYARVHSDPDEAIKNRVGKKIFISSEQYINQPDRKIVYPVFEEEIIREPKFQDGYKSSFKNLGITGDFILRVTVYDKDKALGGFLYAPNEDKIITIYEGVFLNVFRE